MPTTIHYDFEACEKSAEQLISLNKKWEANRPPITGNRRTGSFYG